MESKKESKAQDPLYAEPHWFALYTKPRAEKKLKDSLDKMQIPNFLPLLSVKKKWSDRFKIIDTPLFPSYIFVKILYAEESLKVLKDPNSVSFVHFAGKPASIEESDIEMLEIFLREYPEKIKIEEESKLKPGNSVLIKNGPFSGRTAIIEKIKNVYHIVLILSALNKTLRIEVKKEDLEL